MSEAAGRDGVGSFVSRQHRLASHTDWIVSFSRWIQDSYIVINNQLYNYLAKITTTNCIHSVCISLLQLVYHYASFK